MLGMTRTAGGLCKVASRPFEVSKARIRYVRLTSIPVVRFAQMAAARQFSGMAKLALADGQRGADIKNLHAESSRQKGRRFESSAEMRDATLSTLRNRVRFSIGRCRLWSER